MKLFPISMLLCLLAVSPLRAEKIVLVAGGGAAEKDAAAAAATFNGIQPKFRNGRNHSWTLTSTNK